MDLKQFAAVAGKSGLYKVVKPTRSGVILEALDEKKSKCVANANSRVSLLKEISIYTTDAEGAVLLEEVFQTINDKYGKDLPVSAQDDVNALSGFLTEIVPEYDEDRVYHSDMKKLVTWYQTIASYAPEAFEKAEEDKKEEKA